MKRKNIVLNGINLSYLDNEKDGETLICLHGHYGSGSMFTFVEDFYNGRIILPDQRGHGFSGHAPTYNRNDYVEDLKLLIERLQIKDPIILGHSLGGLNAIQYSAKYKNAKMIIVEDIGTEIEITENVFAKFRNSFSSVWEVDKEFSEHKIQLEPYFIENLFYDGERWRFRFDYTEMFTSLTNLNGVYWNEWNLIECPILLLHGTKSWVCNTKNIKEMAKRMKNTELIIFENTGHTIHDEKREKFCMDVQKFIINNQLK